MSNKAQLLFKGNHKVKKKRFTYSMTRKNNLYTLIVEALEGKEKREIHKSSYPFRPTRSQSNKVIQHVFATKEQPKTQPKAATKEPTKEQPKAATKEPTKEPTKEATTETKKANTK